MFRWAILVLAISICAHVPAESQFTPYVWLSGGGAIGENATVEMWLQVGGAGARYLYSIGPVGGQGTLDSQGRARHVIPVPNARALIGTHVVLKVTAGTNFPYDTYTRHWIVGAPGTPRFRKVASSPYWYAMSASGLLADGTILLVLQNLAWIIQPNTGVSSALIGLHRHYYTPPTVVPLSDGTALIVGLDWSWNPRAELCIPSTGTFIDLGAVPHWGWQAVACAIRHPVTGNACVLFAGGCTMQGVTSSAWLFDARTRRITLLPRMVCGRARAGSTVHPAGAVVISGGMDGQSQALDRVEAFLLSTRQFIDLGQMARRRYGHASVLLGPHHILIAAGISAGGAACMDAELFDLIQRKPYRLPIRLVSARDWSLDLAPCVLTPLPPGGVLLSGGLNPNIEFLTPSGSIPLPPIPARDVHQVIPLGGGRLVAIGSDNLFHFP